MKPLMFALVAIFFFSMQNVVIEKKLAQVSPLANMMFIYVILSTLTLFAILFREPLHLQVDFPEKSQIISVVIVGTLLFIADFCYFSAYKSGGSLVMITTIAVLLPVCASMIKCVWDGTVPSWRHVLAWVFAGIAVFLSK